MYGNGASIDKYLRFNRSTRNYLSSFLISIFIVNHYLIIIQKFLKKALDQQEEEDSQKHLKEKLFRSCYHVSIRH